MAHKTHRTHLELLPPPRPLPPPLLLPPLPPPAPRPRDICADFLLADPALPVITPASASMASRRSSRCLAFLRSPWSITYGILGSFGACRLRLRGSLHVMGSEQAGGQRVLVQTRSWVEWSPVTWSHQSTGGGTKRNNLEHDGARAGWTRLVNRNSSWGTGAAVPCAGHNYGNRAKHAVGYAMPRWNGRGNSKTCVSREEVTDLVLGHRLAKPPLRGSQCFMLAIGRRGGGDAYFKRRPLNVWNGLGYCYPRWAACCVFSNIITSQNLTPQPTEQRGELRGEPTLVSSLITHEK